MIKKIIYFCYYLKNLNWNTFYKFQNYTKHKYNISPLSQWIGILYNSIRYNISILEYYQFKFFEKNHFDKLKWAGTGYMYEYQKIMNPSKHRIILKDKREFYKYYTEFFIHHVFSFDELLNNPNSIKLLYRSSKLVFKISDSNCGKSVKIIPTSSLPQDEIIIFMKREGYDMVETFIEQHKELNKLSPSGVNTVRIFTQINKNNEVEILGCRLRISINSPVDNMAAGNVAAYINEDTGIVEGLGYYSDITKEPIAIHPITKVSILGFKVPYWNECLQLAKSAALKHTQNRSIGWDIAVTDKGPGLIEGNHDWCKLVWQLPVNIGLKEVLERHIKEYKSRF